MTSSVLSSVERKLLSMALMSLLVGISGCGGGTDGNEPTGRVKTKKNITAISLGTLGGGDYGEAIAINNKGQITGASHTSTFNVHGFIWENGVMTDLGTLGGHMSYPSDINDLGQVVGTSSTSSEAVSGFIWEKGVMVDLGVLPGFQYCFPVKINNRGQVVGYCNGYTDPHAFIWEKGVLTDIGPGAAKDINDKGEVVGITSENDVSIGFVWQNGVLLKKITDLGAPPGERPATSVTAINNHSQVVGMTTTPQSGRAFIWDSCEMTILPSLPSTIRSSATTLNDKGQVIGNTYLSSTGRPNAVIWQDGGVMDLGVLLVTLRLWPWLLIIRA